MGYVLIVIGLFVGFIYLISKVKKVSFWQAFFDVIFGALESSSNNLKRNLNKAERQNEGSAEQMKKISDVRENLSTYDKKVSEAKKTVNNHFKDGN